MRPLGLYRSPGSSNSGTRALRSTFPYVSPRKFRRTWGVRHASAGRSRRRLPQFGRAAFIVFASSAVTGFLFRVFSKTNTTQTWDKPSFLDSHTFRSFTLVDKEPISSTSSIFRIRPTDGSLDAKQLQELWDSGIWSVQVKQPQLQIVRAYTPLPPDTDLKNGPVDDTSNELRLLIRKEECGEVSGYLHQLPNGSQIEVRRANIEYRLSETATEILFLAGGTGIAPAMQLAFAMSRRPHSSAHILWANRRREDCVGCISPASAAKSSTRSWLQRIWHTSSIGESRKPEIDTRSPSSIVRQLQRYEMLSKDNGGQKISVECFIDDEQTFIEPDRIRKYLKTRAVNDVDDFRPSRCILISGPDGFVTCWAGKKPVEGSQDSQGPLNGILSRLDLGGWKVWKL